MLLALSVLLLLQHIVHRDIKPENLLLTADKAIKLADFGLAISSAEERPVTRAGTLDYMAPEVIMLKEGRVSINQSKQSNWLALLPWQQNPTTQQLSAVEKKASQLCQWPNNPGHKHQGADHKQEATQAMVDWPHTS